MFLAIHASKLPIPISNPESIRKRLLVQDSFGIFSSYASLNRANLHFSREDDVFDVIYYDDLSRFTRLI